MPFLGNVLNLNGSYVKFDLDRLTFISFDLAVPEKHDIDKINVMRQLCKTRETIDVLPLGLNRLLAVKSEDSLEKTSVFIFPRSSSSHNL